VALREAEERFRTAFEEAPVGMALASLDGRLLQVNRAMCEITGHSREQLEATTFGSITHPDDAAHDRGEMQRLVAGESSNYRAERRYLHAAGHPVPVDLSVAVIRDAGGAPTHFLAQVHDITERKRFEGQLQYLVDHDALTGMFNRRRFEQELSRELARSERYQAGGALLAIDLDHFKYVNDTLGHSVGDELITRTGSLFRARLRATDIIARLGGDEFAVILPGADRKEAELVADKLLGVLRSAGPLESGADTPKRVTASIGVALFGSSRSTSEELLVEADIAMYEAKESGRDRFEVYDFEQNRQGRMQARLTWVDRIREALEQDRFVLHAQPILSLNGDQVPRHELLIRMIGEGDDLIPPGTFLYIGERFDLIQEIDGWVLRRAIALLARAKHAGSPLHLEVNLSAKSVTDPTLAGFVAEQLDAAGIDGHGLCVEVTETAAIVNVDRAKEFAHTLGELGCEFALDDFGAGFASFYYLKHMAFDYVKIDGEFIRHLPSSRVNQLVVKSVVDIARGLAKRTIAEFVGDEETLALLRRYGVDYAQGFHIAKPQSLEQLDLTEPVLAPPARHTVS
jgi:diguanylate cyclase (GGDEF)-like protein/PAS domain S-box-containing protein